MPPRFLSPRTDVVSPEQVRSLRERRGWTAEEMADAVHASPLEVVAWEAGTVAVPADQAARIRWQEQVARLAEAAAAAQERPCPWVRENAPDLYERLFANGPFLAGRDAPLFAHLAACDHCRAVRDQANAIGGFPVEPETSGSLEARYWRWVERLPRRARTPFEWAGIIVPFAFFASFLLAIDDRNGLSVGVVFGLIAWFSALVMLSSVTRDLVVALLSGLAAVVGGLLGLAVGGDSVDLGDPRTWAAALAVGLGIGLLTWWGIRYKPDPEAKATARDPEAALQAIYALQPRCDPALIRALVDDWRAHHPPGSDAAGAEPGGPPRELPD